MNSFMFDDNGKSKLPYSESFDTGTYFMVFFFILILQGKGIYQDALFCFFV